MIKSHIIDQILAVLSLTALVAVGFPGSPALGQSQTGGSIPHRAMLSLDGPWQSATTQNPIRTPGDSAWQNVTLPLLSWTAIDGGPHFIWYRRELYIPSEWSDSRFFLDARGIRYDPRLYIDGKAIAEQYNGWAPFTTEITPYVQAGRHYTLEFRCSDRNAVLDKNGKMLAPTGGYKDAIGVWDDIILKSKPLDELRDDDLVINPSTRGKSLSLSGSVDSTRHGLWVTATVVDKGHDTVTIGPTQVASNGTWKMSGTFASAHYWSPEDPYLYLVRISLLEGKNGRPLDCYQQQFGFKEIWTDGPDFYLNGVKRHLLGTATWPTASVQSSGIIDQAVHNIRQSNAIIFRLHNQIWPEEWLDAADREGLLIIDETPLYTDQGSYAYNDPEFWQNYRDIVSGMIKRDRNHPSLAIWSMGNEILFMGNLKYDPDLPKQEGDIGRFAKSIDPNHPVTFEADQDPDGAYDVIGLHYPHESPWVHDYPNTTDWLGARTTTEAEGGMLGTRSTSFFWERKKPLYIGEYLWMPQHDYSNGTIFFGDDAYQNRDLFQTHAQARAFFDQTIGYRRSGVSGISPWSAIGFGGHIDSPELYATQRDMFAPLGAFLKSRGLRYFSGEKSKLIFDVFDDDGKYHNFELRLILHGSDRILSSERFSMASGDYLPIGLTYTAPKVTSISSMKMDSVLLAEGKVVQREPYTVRLFPRQPLSAPSGFKLLTYDPSGKWSPSVRSLSFLDTCDVSKTILIIAQDSLSPAKRSNNDESDSSVPVIRTYSSLTRSFLAFLHRGGRAIVLEQESLAALGLGLTVVDDSTTMTFPMRTSNPVLAGLTAGDLSFWRSDNYVTHHEVRRPTFGGARAITVSGGSDELDRAPILDLRIGSGRVIIVEAVVGEKRSTEPAAALILQNAVRTLSDWRPATQKRTVLFASDAFAQSLTALDVDYQRVAETGNMVADPTDANVIIDGSVNDTNRLRSSIRSTLSNGGTVYWHDPDSAAFAAVRDLLGAQGMKINSASSGTSLNLRESSYLDGISREDVCYTESTQAWDRPLSHLADSAAAALVPATLQKQALRVDAGTGQLVGGSVLNSSGAAAATFTDAGTVTFSVNAPRTGTYPLTFTASGTQDSGEYPMVEVDVNTVQSTWHSLTQSDLLEYSTLVSLRPGKNEIGLRFINPGGKREITIGTIALYSEANYPPGAEQLVLPGALVTWPSGTGRVVIDEMNWNRAGENAVKGNRYASVLLRNLGFEFSAPSDGESTAIPLEGFKLMGESPFFAQSTDVISLRSNGTVEAVFECANTGRYAIRIDGYSTPCYGEYADANISVDGKELATVNVHSLTAASFVVGALPLEAGQHSVRISFLNDRSNSTEDRNLFITGVSVQPRYQ